ncbi:MAG: glycoside hydrolase family 25 protein [Oscillospiraceae bacterium]
MRKKIAAMILTLAALLSLAACGETPPDPHEGMIYVNAGGGGEWLYPAKGVTASDYKAEDFVSDGNLVSYTGEDYDAALGVDVSFYQGDIDWQAVADSGVEFAMIRCGYRGASEGKLFEDEKFRQNIEGATAAGLRVGVYFFSQSIGAREAAEEAEYVLSLIKDYAVTLPVAFDWEPLDDSRASDVERDELTASAVVFCEMIKDAGYSPCVYLYRSLGYHDYDLSRLSGYDLWVGAPGEAPDFYYAHSMWQFSFTGKIPGIGTDVDLNLRMTPVAQPAPSASPNGSQ